MKKFILFIIFILSSQLYPVLPPLYQSIKEIDKIILDKHINEYITSGESILKIEAQEYGYEITTNRQKIFAKVIYKPRQTPGPTLFDIEFEAR